MTEHLHTPNSPRKSEIIDPHILTLHKENVERWKNINPYDYEYGKLVSDILQNGEISKDRTGVGTIKELRVEILEIL